MSALSDMASHLTATIGHQFNQPQSGAPILTLRERRHASGAKSTACIACGRELIELLNGSFVGSAVDGTSCWW